MLLLGMMPAHTAAAAADLPSWCRSPKSPEVVITPHMTQIQYDLTKTKDQLNDIDTDTINPYGKTVHSDTGGLMRGGIRTEYRTTFGGLSFGLKGRGQSCIWVDKIQVSITLSPTIYIAREYASGTCMFNAVRDHEMKHVAVDKGLMSRYAQQVDTALKAELQRQHIYGPMPTAQQGQLQQHVQSRIVTVMDTTLAQLNAERRRQQQNVDTLSEYQRVNAVCR